MNAWDFFINDLKSGRLNHAYMISGGDGAAAAEFLRRAARAVVCTNKGAEEIPCGKCLDCTKADSGTHPDIYKIPAEGKKIVVDDIAGLVGDCFVKPLESEYKVYCLYNLEEANEKAQNKLLKILEEPVKNTLFLLGAANPQYVLPTIKSRVKKLTLEDNLMFFLSAAASPEFTVIRDSIAAMYRDMRASSDILEFVNSFSRFRDLSNGFLGQLELYTRDIILYKSGNADLLLYKAKKGDIMVAAEDFSLPALNGIMKNINAARKNLSYNVNTVPVLDNLLFSILEEKHKHPSSGKKEI